MRTITVIGGGSWGTALAIAFTRSQTKHNVRLWAVETDLIERMQQTRENDVFLPGCPLPEDILITNDLSEAATGADIIVSVIPTQFLRGVWEKLLPSITPATIILSASKGLEHDTLLRPTEAIAHIIGDRFKPKLAALSGPSFAKEVAAGLPAAIVIASEDETIARDLQTELAGPTFRLYTNTDVAGVEVGAAIKNIIAIAAGVADGLELGANARAALITRGLVEITRLAVAMGGRQETMAGLAGMGDLVLTCTGSLSRNRTVGLELAKGRTLEEITGPMKMIAEGVETTRVAMELARKLQIEMPIAEMMHRILFEGQDPRGGVRALLTRSLKEE